MFWEIKNTNYLIVSGDFDHNPIIYIIISILIKFSKKGEGEVWFFNIGHIRFKESSGEQFTLDDEFDF